MGWFIYGLIVGALGMGLVQWAQDESRHLSWTIWVIGAMAVLLGGLALQHFFASRKELEPKAAWRGVLFMGIPAILLASAAAWLLFSSS